MFGNDKQNIKQTELFGEQLMKGNLGVINDMVAPNFVDHDPAPAQGKGAEGLKDFWVSFRTAFPDMKIEVEQMVADDDKVAIAYTVSGTNEGSFDGHEPTGKRMSVRGLQIACFEDGMLVERWGMSDELTIHKQLGLVSENV